MADSSPFVVRAATTADAEAIGAVNVAAGRVAWARFLTPEALDGFEPPVDRWRERLAVAGAGEGWVAADADEVVGYSLVRSSECPDGEPGEVTGLYTHPRVWGRGAGRILLARGLDALRASGCREAVLWTEARNERARRIYERMGWRLDGARRDRLFLGEPIREVRYRIELVAAARRPGDDGDA